MSSEFGSSQVFGMSEAAFEEQLMKGVGSSVSVPGVGGEDVSRITFVDESAADLYGSESEDEEEDRSKVPAVPIDLTGELPPITIQVTFRGTMVPRPKASQLVSSHPSIIKTKDGRSNYDLGPIGG